MRDRAMVGALALALMAAASEAIGQDPAAQVERRKAVAERLGTGAAQRHRSKADLLRMPAVVDELQLSDEQRAKLDEALVAQAAEVKRRGGEMVAARARLKASGDPEAEAAFRSEGIAYALALTRVDERPLVKILDKDQARRLEQLLIRAEGVLAFDRPEVVERLGVAPDQAQAFKEALERGRRAARVAESTAPDPSSTGPSAEAGRKRARSAAIAARSRGIDAVLAELTVSQQAAYRKMIGKPFDFGDPGPAPASPAPASAPAPVPVPVPGPESTT